MQRCMWLFLFAITTELHAEDLNPGKWPQPLPDLPSWVRHPEDWPDPPTVPPPDPKTLKFQSNVKKFLRSVKRANSTGTKQQWQLAASIKDERPKRHGLVLAEGKKALDDAEVLARKIAAGKKALDNAEAATLKALDETSRKQPLPGLRDDPPEHFHASLEHLRHVKGFESHLKGLIGNDDTPDEMTWKNISEFKPSHPFNSTFWVILCGDHGKHAVGIWKDVCKSSYFIYHKRFRKTVCGSDVKAITDAETEEECAALVGKDAECSKVFHYIPKPTKECKCVLKDKVCAPTDNDKGTVFWIE